MSLHLGSHNLTPHLWDDCFQPEVKSPHQMTPFAASEKITTVSNRLQKSLS